MSSSEKKRPEVGDLYRDNDPRAQGRIVKVVYVSPFGTLKRVEVETVEHWNEKLIGRRTWVNGERLANSAGRQTGYTKVSH